MTWSKDYTLIQSRVGTMSARAREMPCRGFHGKAVLSRMHRIRQVEGTGWARALEEQ